MKNLYIMSGKARSGKDTAAAYISVKTGFKTYALASPIKELTKRWLQVDDTYVEGGEYSVREKMTCFLLDTQFYCLDILIYDMFKSHELITPVKAKEVAQAIISGITEEDGINIFTNSNGVKVLVATPRKILQVIGTEGFRDTVSDEFWLEMAPTSEVIITDVRFQNEYDYFRKMDSINIHITRDSVEEISGATNHASEQGIALEWGLQDYGISNNGTLGDLYEELDDIMKAYEREEVC